MTNTTFPNLVVKTEYFEIKNFEEVNESDRLYGRYSTKAILSIFYKFGKDVIEYKKEAYFNNVEDVIEDLRHLYKGEKELWDSEKVFYGVIILE